MKEKEISTISQQKMIQRGAKFLCNWLNISFNLIEGTYRRICFKDKLFYL
jgi:hypothetical protein